MGGACYHITDNVPQVKELSLRLLRHVGLQGLANVEFKLDQRGGVLKLIECNARFAAPDCLIAASGFDLPLFVYSRLTGRPHPPLRNFKAGVRLWFPGQDFRAFREMRRMGLITFPGWVSSILHRQSFPYFRWKDPLPALVLCARTARAYTSSRLARLMPLMFSTSNGHETETKPDRTSLSPAAQAKIDSARSTGVGAN
jgi:predicted ATP-grasp superfamily ATP-dependent carboligase